MNVGVTFDEAWKRYGLRPGVSDGLEPKMRHLVESLAHVPVDVGRIRTSLSQLLTLLASTEGRTHTNCTAVDTVLALGNIYWPDLPDPIDGVLADMAAALHDTIAAPEVAAIFESTPEQLLARLEAR